MTLLAYAVRADALHHSKRLDTTSCTPAHYTSPPLRPKPHHKHLTDAIHHLRGGLVTTSYANAVTTFKYAALASILWALLAALIRTVFRAATPKKLGDAISAQMAAETRRAQSETRRIKAAAVSRMKKLKAEIESLKSDKQALEMSRASSTAAAVEAAEERARQAANKVRWAEEEAKGLAERARKAELKARLAEEAASAQSDARREAEAGARIMASLSTAPRADAAGRAEPGADAAAAPARQQLHVASMRVLAAKAIADRDRAFSIVAKQRETLQAAADWLAAEQAAARRRVSRDVVASGAWIPFA